MMGKLFDKLIKYAETKLNVLKLSFVERVALVMGFCMFLMMCMFVSLVIIIELGLGLGLMIGDWVGFVAAGYFITAGFFTLILVGIYTARRKLMRFFTNVFIKLLTDDDENEEV